MGHGRPHEAGPSPGWLDDASGAALCPLFGEQALLEDADMHPHTAAVVAAGPCKLLVLYR